MAGEPLDPGGMEAGPVAVLGCGTMGVGIAQAFAAAGFPTRVWARSEASVERAEAALGRNLTFVHEAGLLDDPEAARARVSFATDLAVALGEAGLVVEAVAEDLGVKRELFARLDSLCPPEVPLGTNTSGLSVTAIARDTGRPERVVATHFWNPAHLMPLVEVGLGRATAEPILQRVVALLRAIGKVPVVVRKEVPGFLGTRLQQAVVREAIHLLEQGVASAEDIDTVVKTSFGIRFPAIGPLETTDLGGLDVVHAIHQYLLPDLCSSATPSPLLTRLVGEGRLGVKAGAGFYEWTPERAAEVGRARDEELVRRLKLMREQGGAERWR